jgi:hypothetical protein
MKSNWNERELTDRLRRLSTQPPNLAFEQRLTVSLGLAAEELRASRLPEPRRSKTKRRPYVRAALLLGAALAAGAAASQAWSARHTAMPHAADAGD